MPLDDGATESERKSDCDSGCDAELWLTAASMLKTRDLGYSADENYLATLVSRGHGLVLRHLLHYCRPVVQLCPCRRRMRCDRATSYWPPALPAAAAEEAQRGSGADPAGTDRRSRRPGTCSPP